MLANELTRLARPVLVPWLVLAVTLTMGCSDDESGPPGSEPPPDEVPTRECPTGWISAENGAACDAVLPDEPCSPGTMPTLGGLCEPVGTTSCAPGFAPSESGWGCEDILPAEPCEGATRGVLGKSECQPVGDCAAAFPPPEATLFVDDDFAPAQLDGAHFNTIAEAIAAAPSSAVVAVEAGTYEEFLVVDAPISLVGQCPALVELRAPAASPEPGIRIGASDVHVRGMTISGHHNGVFVASNGTANLRELVLDANRSVNLFAESSPDVSIADSVLRRGFDEEGAFGYGVFANGGARNPKRASPPRSSWCEIRGHVPTAMTATPWSSSRALVVS